MPTFVKNDAAAQAFETVVQLNPSHAGAMLELSIVYEKQKDLVKAIAACQQALLIQPELPDGHRTLGRLYVKLGKQELEQANAKTEVEALKKLGY